MPGVAAPAIGR